MKKAVAAGIVVVAALAALFIFSLIASAQGAPPVPHTGGGFEQCVACHGTSGAKPVPANHSGYPQNTCTGCHAPAKPAPASTPVSTPPAKPAPQATSTAPSRVDACLACHGQQNLNMPLPSGETLPLYIDGQAFSASIHGSKLLCTDCHSSVTGYPHPKRTISSRREYNIAQYEVCKRCHFGNYTKTLDSAHYEILSRGDLRAPLCTDCHGAHSVTAPAQPRSRISLTCSRCHEKLNDEYAGSVHGKALIEEKNFDVPVCTDCHRSHTIEDPRTAAFRLRSVQLCSNCHSNEKLMSKYDISTNVVRSYLQDFHGASVALVARESKDIWVKEAVCTDCHGVHAIERVDDPESPVIKANLVTTCAKCHPDASANFPGSWLSHYEPGMDKAQLVFATQWFYRLMIPFVLLGLSAHVLLDIWRAITNR